MQLTGKSLQNPLYRPDSCPTRYEGQELRGSVGGPRSGLASRHIPQSSFPGAMNLESYRMLKNEADIFISIWLLPVLPWWEPRREALLTRKHRQCVSDPGNGGWKGSFPKQPTWIVFKAQLQKGPQLISFNIMVNVHMYIYFEIIAYYNCRRCNSSYKNTCKSCHHIF